jgi:hypothetical protein
MVRALIDVGGMSIASVREVLAAADSPDNSPFTVLGHMQEHLSPTRDPGEGEEWEKAEQQVTELLERRGWVAADRCSAPARALVAALATFAELGRGDLVELLEVYADACLRMAEIDVALVIRDRGLDDVIEGAVIATVIGEALMTALRRLAHQHVTAEVMGVSVGEEE